MERKYFIPAASVLAAFLAGAAQAQDEFSGDTRLACEAVLCLSTGSPPAECAPALRRYFSITHRRLAQTISRRSRFLQLCPTAQQTPQMAALITAQAQGAGRCDAAVLNAALRQGAEPGLTLIDNRLPAHCMAYVTHAYTDFAGSLPRYVGLPERGGHWAPAHEYVQAQRAYDARIRAEDAAVHGRDVPSDAGGR